MVHTPETADPTTATDKEVAESEEGFSLMELMVVLVILALLATVVVINVFPIIGQGNQTKAETDIRQFEAALGLYCTQNLVCPTTEQGLQALVSAPPDLARPERYPNGGYIRSVPDDPWGNPYRYEAPATRSGGPYDIYSLGADGLPGGEGENADIGNWD